MVLDSAPTRPELSSCPKDNPRPQSGDSGVVLLKLQPVQNHLGARLLAPGPHLQSLNQQVRPQAMHL